MLTFFRGIAVPSAAVEDIVADIRERGLHEGGRRWRMFQQWPSDPAALFAKPDLTTHDTRGESVPKLPAICACGDEDGAAHYAWRHNRSGDNDTPVIIAFTAPIECVDVDGKDFLYTAIQFGQPERARGVLTELFGPGILRYADPAWAKGDPSYAIAMCDLATIDPEIIRAHHANRSVIAGRYGTVFRSAFTVRLPVDATAIVRVWVPKSEPAPAVPDVSLDNVR